MSHKIYLLMANVGQYDESQDFPVKAYTNKDLAEKHLEGAINYVSEFVRNGPSDYYNREARIYRETYKNPFDTLSVCYDWQSYYLEEVDLYL